MSSILERPRARGAEPEHRRADAGKAGAPPRPTSEWVVEARNVHREYRLGGSVVHALQGVSLAVPPGDFVAVTGPSGSGKSTLLHVLGGIDRPTRGAAFLGGRDLSALADAERSRLRLEEVGLVFQRFHLLPMLTAQENVELPMAEAGASRSERRERAARLLASVGLADRTGHRPGELSGGQRQRVAIARALANGPRLVLADEPTGELDRATSDGLLDLFSEINEAGTTILVATHDLRLAERAARRVELVDGRWRE